jgi:hypothetical protein
MLIGLRSGCCVCKLKFRTIDFNGLPYILCSKIFCFSELFKNKITVNLLFNDTVSFLKIL